MRPAVVTVATFEGGDSFNVIPDSARIRGTVRTFDDDVRDTIEAFLEKIFFSTCEAVGAKAEFRYVRGYPAVINDPLEKKRLEGVVQDLFDHELIKHIPAQMGMGDFTYH